MGAPLRSLLALLVCVGVCGGLQCWCAAHARTHNTRGMHALHARRREEEGVEERPAQRLGAAAVALMSLVVTHPAA